MRSSTNLVLLCWRVLNTSVLQWSGWPIAALRFVCFFRTRSPRCRCVKKVRRAKQGLSHKLECRRGFQSGVALSLLERRMMDGIFFMCEPVSLCHSLAVLSVFGMPKLVGLRVTVANVLLGFRSLSGDKSDFLRW